MRIVFAGTPAFAVPALRAVLDRGEVVAVYTQPDRPAGRGRGMQASPVKIEALGRGIGLVGRGILQGLGSAWQDGRYQGGDRPK